MTNEPDRTKVEKAMHAYHVFNFAYKAIIAGLGINPSQGEGMRIWQFVEEVAKNDCTLNVTGAELAQMSPPMTQAMRHHYEKQTAEQIARDREIAEELVKARGGFHTPPPEAK